MSYQSMFQGLVAQNLVSLPDPMHSKKLMKMAWKDQIYKLGKVAQKKIFDENLTFARPIYPLKIRLSVINNQFCKPFFPSIFQTLNGFLHLFGKG